MLEFFFGALDIFGTVGLFHGTGDYSIAALSFGCTATLCCTRLGHSAPQSNELWSLGAILTGSMAWRLYAQGLSNHPHPTLLGL